MGATRYPVSPPRTRDHSIMSQSPSITILGAGGIGCAIGYTLLKRGHDVEFVDASQRKVAQGNEFGVEVAGHGTERARFTLFDDWHPEEPGLIILCTKCYDNALVLDRIHPDSTVFPVQNGFDPQLQKRCEFEGIASFVSECESDRPRTRITRPGDLHIGACGHDAPLPEELRAIGDSLANQTIFTLKAVPDILPFKHTKLMYNAAISPLAAISGLDNGQLLTHACEKAVLRIPPGELRDTQAFGHPAGDRRTVPSRHRQRHIEDSIAGHTHVGPLLEEPSRNLLLHVGRYPDRPDRSRQLQWAPRSTGRGFPLSTQSSVVRSDQSIGPRSSDAYHGLSPGDVLVKLDGSTVLVTGGAGFIGSHVVSLLHAHDCRIRVIELPDATTGHLEDCDIRRVDIRDRDAVMEATRGCDLVIHLAANPNLWARIPPISRR